jgi:drug/metabolite transporter (DMT)-like permease
MTTPAIEPYIIVLSLATPVVGATIWLAGRAVARQADEPMPRSMRRAAVILILAGPLNLLVRFCLGDRLAAASQNPAIGYALAAATFIGLGWYLGIFKRISNREKPH